MLIIVTALTIEAKPIVEWLNLKRDNTINSHEVYRADSVSLIVSGVGNVSSAIATTLLISEFAESKLVKKPIVLNIGFSASKNEGIGTLCQINKISYLEKDYYPELNLNFKTNEASLVSVNSPVSNRNLMENGVLYDMEAFGVYSATSKFIDCTSSYFFKIVADNGDDSFYSKEKGGELFNKNKKIILAIIEILLNHTKDKIGMLREDYKVYQNILKASSISATQANLLNEPILTALSSGIEVKDILSKLESINLLNKREITPFIESYINSLNP